MYFKDPFIKKIILYLYFWIIFWGLLICCTENIVLNEFIKILKSIYSRKIDLIQIVFNMSRKQMKRKRTKEPRIKDTNSVFFMLKKIDSYRFSIRYLDTIDTSEVTNSVICVILGQWNGNSNCYFRSDSAEWKRYCNTCGQYLSAYYMLPGLQAMSKRNNLRNHSYRRASLMTIKWHTQHCSRPTVLYFYYTEYILF